MSNREVKAFILRAVHQVGGSTLPDSTLRAAVRLAFPHITWTEGDLAEAIRSVESLGWIAGTSDELLGVIWGLTPAGKLRAQQLG